MGTSQFIMNLPNWLRYNDSNSSIHLESTFHTCVWMEEINYKILSHLDTMIQIPTFKQNPHFTFAYGWKESIT